MHILDRLRLKEIKGTATLEELAAADEIERLEKLVYSGEVKPYIQLGDTVNEMIERVARTLFEKPRYEGEPEPRPCRKWEEVHEYDRAIWYFLARTAIEAMRESTHEMNLAGYYATECEIDANAHATAFKAMIEQALK